MEEYAFRRYVNAIEYLARKGIVLPDNLPGSKPICAECVSDLAADERLKEALNTPKEK